MRNIILKGTKTQIEAFIKKSENTLKTKYTLNPTQKVDVSRLIHVFFAMV